MHRTLRIVGFPPWLVQVEAKFGNQIAAPFPSRRFPLWLVQVEANLAVGHVAEPNEATTDASSVECSNVEQTSRLVARRGLPSTQGGWRAGEYGTVILDASQP